ncbi:polysaccharide deacetylase family protein [Rhodococcus fascians]|nr:polysaccharide deacetylase family protein [Rhodococcus fascians]
MSKHAEHAAESLLFTNTFESPSLLLVWVGRSAAPRKRKYPEHESSRWFYDRAMKQAVAVPFATRQLAGLGTERHEAHEQRLTLTFDNSPTSGVIEDVLDTLRAEDIHATFFAVGSDLEYETRVGGQSESGGRG